VNAEITGEIAHIDGGQVIDHANDGRGVLGGGRCPAWWTGVHRVLLAWTLHLPPSAVSLVRDVHFAGPHSAQRG
jgi:hypothetical protein